jgi:hypothetical protein
MIDSLTENLKMRFSYLRGNAKNIRILENPFSVEVSDASELET